MFTDLAIVRITMMPKGGGGAIVVTFRHPPYGTFLRLYDNFDVIFPRHYFLTVTKDCIEESLLSTLLRTV